MLLAIGMCHRIFHTSPIHDKGIPIRLLQDTGSSLEDIKNILFNGTCNVLAFDKSALLGTAKSDKARDKGFVFGEVMKTKEPLAFATRNGDREFSDIVNWVIQALFFDEEQDLKKKPSLYQNYTNMAFYYASGFHECQILC